LTIESFGGKAFNLFKMAAFNKVAVPPFFVVSADLYRLLLKEDKALAQMVGRLNDGLKLPQVEELTEKIRGYFGKVTLPTAAEKEIITAYQNLDGIKPLVAVRSSATTEDLAEASFAGQQDTYLNVSGDRQLLTSVKKCLASLFTTRAVMYRRRQKVSQKRAALSVVVQKMVKPVVSGVAFSVEPTTGFARVVRIEAAFGLGEGIVQGLVTPDTFLVTKSGVMLARDMGAKEKQVVKAAGRGTKIVATSKKQARSWTLTDGQVLRLAETVKEIESYYGHFVDVEYAVDSKGKIWLLQVRPETKWQALADKNPSLIPLSQARLDAEVARKPTLTGLGVSPGAAAGRAVFLGEGESLLKVKPGNILLTKRTDPDMVPAMQVCGGVVTAVGGRTSHAAIVSRELTLPAVVGTENLGQLKRLDGQDLTIDGDTGLVYRGLLPLKKRSADIDTGNVPKTRTRVGLILADVNQAFKLSKLSENDFEVGLLRAEFILGRIGIHPKALDEFDQGKLARTAPKVSQAIKDKLVSSGFTSGKKYFVDGLASGMGAFAQAFFGRPVIYRTTDFKTNEYKAQLVGGELYEPDEDNPMLGNRGTGRYLQDENLKYLGWELEALDIARSKFEGDNLELMLPFVRTLFEAQEALKFIKAKAKTGKLKVIAMSEIPSNALIATEFIKVFDGFSLGSNDMTQLVLGTDRDNQKLAATYDEHDPAVVKAILATIFAGLKQGKKVGFCGQGVSDSVIIAGLVSIAGITSASVVPDRYLKTKELIASLEKQKIKVKDLGEWLAASFKRKYRASQSAKDALYVNVDWRGVVASALNLGGISSFAAAQKLIDKRR